MIMIPDDKMKKKWNLETIYISLGIFDVWESCIVYCFSKRDGLGLYLQVYGSFTQE